MKVSQKEMKAALSRVAATSDGQIVFAMICKDCGFFNNYMDLNDANKTQAFAGMRGVYAKIRKFIPKKSLVKIEHDVQFITDDVEKKPATKKGTKK